MPARRHQSAAKLLPAAASFWLPAQVFMLARRHQSAAKLLPGAASFWPPAQVFMPTYRHQSAAKLLACTAARRCIFLASRAGICARSPAPICSQTAARRCILLAHAAARRCSSLASRAGIYAWLPAPTCIFLASRACAHLLPPICSRSAWPHSDGALPRRYLRRPGARCQHQAIAPGPLLPFILCVARCCVLARLPRSRPRPTAAAALPARTTCACARAAARLLLCLETKGRRAWRSSAGQQCGPVSAHGWGAGGTGAPTGWRAASSHGPARPAGLWAPLVEA